MLLLKANWRAVSLAGQSAKFNGSQLANTMAIHVQRGAYVMCKNNFNRQRHLHNTI